MTREELDKLATWMGWTIPESRRPDHEPWWMDEGSNQREPQLYMGDAWFIVEKLRGEGWSFELRTYDGGKWLAMVQYINSSRPIQGLGDTAPAAICAAAAAALASAGAAAGRAKGGAE